MEKSTENQSGHGKRKLAVEIGSASLGLTMAGTAAYYLRKKRLRDLANREPDAHGGLARDKAAIFDEPRLSLKQRELMAAAAVRIYHATLEPNGVLKQGDLIAALPDATERQIQKAVSYLGDKGLIHLKQLEGGRGQRGYEATDALDWAMQEGNYPLLADAEAELLNVYAGEEPVL
ncbi:MAG: hypothetical protein JWN75_1272 [Candidatus Saccharibacteria bacterium]|nr:hypothetical protein [Candidatus Saccharibacteria bacterium]MDB5181382.1 hypothetical protein [Candidatus Saccharibacteria bacterium]